jgi:myo-inositol-hexaphosphate 3-phosphohydrolase
VLEEAEDPAMKKENYMKQVLKGAQEKVKGDYLNDQLEGEVIYYNENGSILKIETWSDGKLISTRGAGQ